MPDSVKAISLSVKKLCPAKMYLQWDFKMVNSIYPNEHFQMRRKTILSNKPHIFTQFQNEIYTGCPGDIYPGIWQVWFVPATAEKQRLRVHIVAKNTIGINRKIKTPMETLYDELYRTLPGAIVKKDGDSIRVIYAELATFELNKAQIMKKAYPNFEHFSYILNRHGATRFFLDGHTDNTGKLENNLILSATRAENARLLLEKYGIDTNRIQTRAFASSLPTADNNTELGRQANRRVEFVIYPFSE